MAFGETDPSEHRGGAGNSQANVPGKVTFTRRELDRILGLYGRMVAAGEWRDYAIDFLKDRAVFSVFRRASEVPLYRIEKNPRLARRQGKPLLRVDLEAQPDPSSLSEWIETNGIRVLNVAGPRESESPGIGDRTARLLAAALAPPPGPR